MYTHLGVSVCVCAMRCVCVCVQRKAAVKEGGGVEGDAKTAEEKLKRLRKRNAELVALARQLDDKMKSLKMENDQLVNHTYTHTYTHTHIHTQKPHSTYFRNPNTHNQSMNTD